MYYYCGIRPPKPYSGWFCGVVVYIHINPKPYRTLKEALKGTLKGACGPSGHECVRRIGLRVQGSGATVKEADL